MEKINEQILKTALQKEEGEKAFYLEAASRTESDTAKGIFEELAREEDAHRKKVFDIFKHLKEDRRLEERTVVMDDHAPARLETVFRGAQLDRAVDCTDDICALRVGLDMEKNNVRYYEKLVGTMEDNFENHFYLALFHEERQHYLHIMDAIEYLIDPEGWHYIHQKSMVDGG